MKDSYRAGVTSMNFSCAAGLAVDERLKYLTQGQVTISLSPYMCVCVCVCVLCVCVYICISTMFIDVGGDSFVIWCLVAS